MIDTNEYYGGTYPEPNWCYEDEKVTIDEEDEDYECYMSDMMYEEMMLGDD